MQGFLKWLALGFGVGKLPKAPGTWGALEGLGLFWGLKGLSWPEQLLVVLGLSILGAYGAGLVAQAQGQEDPKEVVVDEIVGQMLTLVGHPFNPWVVGLGFVLFRAFDILKPPPVRQAEGLPQGWGIMADDLVAGLLANLCLWLISPILPL